MVQASSMAQFHYISTSIDRTVYGNMAQLLTQRKGFSPLWSVNGKSIRFLPCVWSHVSYQIYTFTTNTYYIFHMDMVSPLCGFSFCLIEEPFCLLFLFYISQYLTFLLCGPSYVLLYNTNTYYIAYMALIFHSHSCVGYHMSCKMSLSTETLTTLITWMNLLSFVGRHISYKIIFQTEKFPTLITWIFPLPCVACHMCYHMTFHTTTIITLITCVILLSCVGIHMSYQMNIQTDTFATLVTLSHWLYG